MKTIDKLISDTGVLFCLLSGLKATYWVPDMTVGCFGGWHRRLSIILA
ncbi:hypothetical protein WJX77_006864, partial [Trebouxia sp. C0004]